MPALPLIPSQPVIEASALGHHAAGLPSLLDLPNVAFTHSGRSAIALALELIGVTAGDTVLVPSYHCPTMIAPIERAGAIPSFYPLDWRGQPDLAHLQDVGTARAMLVPHLFGLPRSMSAVAAFCRERGTALIEDCAHCFYGAADGSPVGTSGDFAIGSLPKFFPVVEGGVLASQNTRLPADTMAPRPLRHEFRAAWDIVDMSARAGRLGPVGAVVNWAADLRRRTLRRATARTQPEEPVTPDQIRLQSLADPLLPPKSCRRLERFLAGHVDQASGIRRRRDNYRRIRDGLLGVDGVRPLFAEDPEGCAPYVMPLLAPDPDSAYARMRASRLPVFRWDRVWPSTPRFDSDAGAAWLRQVIQIACHQSITADQAIEIAQRVRACVDADHRPRSSGWVGSGRPPPS